MQRRTKNNFFSFFRKKIWSSQKIYISLQQNLNLHSRNYSFIHICKPTAKVQKIIHINK